MTDSSAMHSQAAHPHAAHPVLRVTAPLVALGATWAVGKAMSSAYTAITGNEPPAAEDRSVSFGRVLAWTVLTATTSAVVQMVIYRAAARALPESTDS